MKIRQVISNSIRFVSAIFLTFVLSISPSSAAENPRKLPDSSNEIQLSYAPLVKQVAPAVVNIYASKKVKVAVSPFANDPFFSQFFGDNFMGGPVRERIINSLGSGVIIDSQGLIITNNHVINDVDEIKVVLSDRTEYVAKVVLADPKVDLALLKIEKPGKTFPYLEFAEINDLEVGDLVLGIGNPFGVGQTVTSGIVSALARTTIGISDYEFFIQTDAAINPGNSGGALVDMRGKLVGINTAILSKSGTSAGIGFATPAIMAETLLKSYKSGGKIIRPWLGASTQDITAEIAESLGLEKPMGVLIKNVYPKSAAEKAGLKTGDIITQIDSRDIPDEKTLKFYVATHDIGSDAVLTVIRDNKLGTVKVKMEKPGEYPARDTTQLEGKYPLDGATVENLSPALADELGVDQTAGVIVTAIKSRSLAVRFAQPGDIILSVNGKEVKDTKQLKDLMESSKRGWKISLQRDKQVINISINQ